MSESNLETKSGIVQKKLFGRGSKSEHLAYFINVDGEEFVLQQRNANPFMNNFFEKYVDKKVECAGTLADYVFFVDKIKII